MKKIIQISDSEKKDGRWFDNLWFRILLITAIALGIFFRTTGLGNKIYSHDEAYTSLYAAGYLGGDVFASLWDGNDKTAEDMQEFLKPTKDKNAIQVLSLMALYRPHQAPLFFILTYYWMQLVGYTPSAIRWLAAIFGLLSIPAMYWLGRELFQSSRAAIISAVMLALSPFHILFSQDARPYSLWTLATLVSSAAFLRAIRKNTMSTWIVYSLALILGIYSHQLFILVILVQGLYFIGVPLLNKKNRFGGFLLACAIAFVFYTPWLYFVITRWQQVTRQVDILSSQIPLYQYIKGWILLFSSPLLDLDFNSTTGNLVSYFLRSLMLLFTAYAFLFLLKQGSKQEKLFPTLIYVITAGGFIAVDLIFGGMRSTTGRYFVPANLATILVVAHFVTKKLDLIPANAGTKWSLLLSMLMAASIISNVNSLLADTWWNKELGRVRQEFVHEINKEQTLLIVSGYHPTNLGDVLLLSFEVGPDIHFRLYEDPTDIKYPSGYRNVYWFPSSSEEVREISIRERFLVREVLMGTLWQIDGLEE